MKAKTYDRQTAKFLAGVGENMPELSGEVMQRWIENPMALQRFLEGLCLLETVPGFKVWRTIKLGTGPKTPDDFRQAFRDGGFCISDWANDILGKPAFAAATEEAEVDLVKITVAELGFTKGARRDQIYERAKKFGLEPCPPEVGPQLRLQYQDQPNGEWALIGMEPITSSDDGLLVFYVRCLDSRRWLNSLWGGSDRVWELADQWIFVRPRK